jgi:hypothetical protein
MADDTPQALTVAQQIREAVRTLNHLTIRGDGGINCPSELDQVVRALAEAAHGLPQAISQLARIASRMASRTDLYDDRLDGSTGAGAATAEWAAAELDDAQPYAGQLGNALNRAAEQLAHLGVR